MTDPDWRAGKVAPKVTDDPRPDDESMGWKPDPTGDGERWWNGRQWTETRQPAPKPEMTAEQMMTALEARAIEGDELSARAIVEIKFLREWGWSARRDAGPHAEKKS